MRPCRADFIPARPVRCHARSPYGITLRLAAQCRIDLVEMQNEPGLRRAALAHQARWHQIARASNDHFVRDDDTTLEQQLLDIAKTQVEPEKSANRAVDDGGGSRGPWYGDLLFIARFTASPLTYEWCARQGKVNRCLRTNLTEPLGTSEGLLSTLQLSLPSDLSLRYFSSLLLLPENQFWCRPIDGPHHRQTCSCDESRDDQRQEKLRHRPA